MKVNFDDYEDAFSRADQYIKEQCSGYNKVCSPDIRKSVTRRIYVKLVSVFWEEYYDCRVSLDDTNVYMHFRCPQDLTAFLLKWS
jgi:hypothetical protein